MQEYQGSILGPTLFLISINELTSNENDNNSMFSHSNYVMSDKFNVMDKGQLLQN